MKKKKNVLLSLNKKRISILNDSIKQEILGGSANSSCHTFYGCASGDYYCGGGGNNQSLLCYTATCNCG